MARIWHGEDFEDTARIGKALLTCLFLDGGSATKPK
jgi:hypothetical protein